MRLYNSLLLLFVVSLAGAAPVDDHSLVDIRSEAGLYNSSSVNMTIEARNHCSEHADSNPDCRYGCGSADYDEHGSRSPLWAAPASNWLMCEKTDRNPIGYWVGRTCYCHFWTNEWCAGNSVREVTGPQLKKLAFRYYRCHKKGT
ncbi:hypothetical protein P154DRAFT_571716 [Amniculicola lignicola CBS 123094]|uniref:Uncharacterized protein n=1 Tax=Amniculicola lignicola CBS 123094 TaxID=1392246 RepID=A0A6A5WTE6_9PLEO|nr:hypothetical protein P154DRAFT_571716 [Amniculicola lignicola CBS 123094]